MMIETFFLSDFINPGIFSSNPALQCIQNSNAFKLKLRTFKIVPRDRESYPKILQYFKVQNFQRFKGDFSAFGLSLA